MFPFVRRKDKNSETIKGILKTMYFPPEFPGVDSFAIPFANLKPDTRLKILLFTYGIIDAFSQGSKLSKEKFDNLCSGVDGYVEEIIGQGISAFMESEFYKNAFDDPDLLKVIELGGRTYNDFASGDKVRGGQSITRLSSLVSMWDR